MEEERKQISFIPSSEYSVVDINSDMLLERFIISLMNVNKE